MHTEEAVAGYCTLSVSACRRAGVASASPPSETPMREKENLCGLYPATASSVCIPRYPQLDSAQSPGPDDDDFEQTAHRAAEVVLILSVMRTRGRAAEAAVASTSIAEVRPSGIVTIKDQRARQLAAETCGGV
eukprot:CAMPEP_0119407534 /NCGR_PEP_ID=MMETSP1335-20130426/1386_1 /TAXON_ID=259385 /ORGANISM="Chrysoculter rhomboideus, Strain RCC1486" /LENGTH=132 /DNA_ID=CAMNT_0007431653 /DNA_START=1 /DNA_END=399 /DNA_ORIENTATION=-